MPPVPAESRLKAGRFLHFQALLSSQILQTTSCASEFSFRRMLVSNRLVIISCSGCQVARQRQAKLPALLHSKGSCALDTLDWIWSAQCGDLITCQIRLLRSAFDDFRTATLRSALSTMGSRARVKGRGQGSRAVQMRQGHQHTTSLMQTGVLASVKKCIIYLSASRQVMLAQQFAHDTSVAPDI